MRTIHRLSVRQIGAVKLPDDRNNMMLADGGNLLLQITRGASGDLNRSWIFRYETDGKRHDLGLGRYQDRTLAEARDKARELRQKLIDGGDPAAERAQASADRAAERAAHARAITFKECAVRCIEAHADSWRNAEHARQWQTTLEQYVYPIIGNLPVSEIDVALIVKVIEPIWKEIPETASRVRGRIEKVLGWATVRGFRSGDNPARWRGHLEELFANKARLAPVKHHAALPYAEIPALVAKLRERDRSADHALEFTILTAARAGEVLGATWVEIDTTAKTWTIPASRMKAGREHKVPLSDRAIALLGKPAQGRLFDVGENALRFVLRGALADDGKPLRELTGGGMTVHGLRSSFRDWCSERTSYPEAVCEQALAHTIGSKTERAYNRTDLFDKRRRLMAEWATFCGKPQASGKVVALR